MKEENAEKTFEIIITKDGKEKTDTCEIPEYTLEEFIKDSKPDIFCERRPAIICIDGYRFSVQASEFHYSFPREDGLDEYIAVEVRGITEKRIKELKGLEERGEEEYQDGTQPIYPFVSIDKVKEVINNHGGLDKKEILREIKELKEIYKPQNTALDDVLTGIANGDEYFLKILKYATRKVGLTQEKAELDKRTQEKSGEDNGEK